MMDRSSLLVAFPGPLVRSLVWRRADMVVFDESGWWLIEEGSTNRRLVTVDAFRPRWAGAIDVGRLIVEIKEWSPIWTRWVANADQYELLYREAASHVACVMTALADLHIGSAVFHTGVAHHLDSSLLQIACAETGVPQMFLYANVVNGRLVPLVQRTSMEDREPFGEIVSEHEANDEVEEFRQNSLAGKWPLLYGQTDLFKGAYKSAVFGILSAAYEVSRREMIRAVRRLWQPRAPGFFDRFEPLGFFAFLRLIQNQRTGIAYYERKRHSGDLPTLAASADHPVLLIAAHYQPEATSFPEGGRLHNHFDIAAKLRNLGYDGPIIYKEHASSYLYYVSYVGQPRVGMNRSEAYYRSLEDLGCVFADPTAVLGLETDTNRRIIPITISGTMAIERSLVGLRTIVTGEPWYKGLPGTVPLSSLTSIDLAVLSSQHDSASVAQEAQAFVSGLVSKTTLLNVPGIGSGKPNWDPASVATFSQEFERLLQAMQRRFQRPASLARPAIEEAES